MKIISGRFKGRSIKIRKTNSFRPTLSRIREDIFNLLKHNKILNINIEDSIFCDLFCGSGSIGLEALSRGAKRVIFNDIDSFNVQLVKDFLLKTESHNYELSNIDAFISKDLISKDTSILYVDPPYDSDMELLRSHILPQIPDYCLIIYETNKRFEKQDFLLKKEYKNKNLYFFRKAIEI